MSLNKKTKIEKSILSLIEISNDLICSYDIAYSLKINRSTVDYILQRLIDYKLIVVEIIKKGALKVPTKFYKLNNLK